MQPPRYDRRKDFTEDYGDNTDHAALNAELDGASQSINKTRDNLALIQRDDGGLANGIVTSDSLSSGLKDEIILEVGVGIDDKIQEAQEAAAESVNAAAFSSESAIASGVSAGQSAASAGSAQASAQSADTSRASAAASEASALASKNAAAASEQSSAANKDTAVASAATAVSAKDAAVLSQNAAAASAVSALASKTAAATSEVNAAASKDSALSSKIDAATSEASAADSEAAARSYMESLVQPYMLIKNDYESTCLIKTGSETISIKAGTTLVVDAVSHTFAVDTPATMPAMAAGTDYSVWVKTDGTAQAMADIYASPAAAPAPGAVKIGGFHYGLVAPGTTVASGAFSTGTITGAGGSMAWAQPLVDKLAGINEYSIWDLCWLVDGEQYGMSYDPYKKMWAGIYLMSDSPHVYGVSAYNTNIGSGTILPFVPAAYGGNGALKYTALNAFNAHELVSAHGLRLPTYDEFMGFAFGVTEGQSLGGAASTVPATLRQPGYTSRIGIEQATGHQYIIGGPIASSHGSAWTGAGRGSWYGSTGLVLLGGFRDAAANSGSRAASFGDALSSSHWGISVRAAGDHLKLVGAAR